MNTRTVDCYNPYDIVKVSRLCLCETPQLFPFVNIFGFIKVFFLHLIRNKTKTQALGRLLANQI